MKSVKQKNTKKQLQPYLTKEDLFEIKISRLLVKLRANNKVMSMIDSETEELIDAVEGYFNERS